MTQSPASPVSTSPAADRAMEKDSWICFRQHDVRHVAIRARFAMRDIPFGYVLRIEALFAHNTAQCSPFPAVTIASPIT